MTLEKCFFLLWIVIGNCVCNQIRLQIFKKVFSLKEKNYIEWLIFTFKFLCAAVLNNYGESRLRSYSGTELFTITIWQPHVQHITFIQVGATKEILKQKKAILIFFSDINTNRFDCKYSLHGLVVGLEVPFNAFVYLKNCTLD